MKKFILILISLLFVTGCMEEKEVTSLQDRGGVKYEINSEVGFTGKYVEFYKDGQKKVEEHLKLGKRHGLYTLWDSNGQKRFQMNYKSGKEDGLLTIWDEEGNVTETKTSKDGELVNP